MNRADLVNVLLPYARDKGAASAALETLLDTIVREVARGGYVRLGSFGTFESAPTKPKVGRNPRTGEPVRIPASVRVRFRPSDAFTAVVKDPTLLPPPGLSSVARAPSTPPTRVRRLTAGQPPRNRLGIVG